MQTLHIGMGTRLRSSADTAYWYGDEAKVQCRHCILEVSVLKLQLLRLPVILWTIHNVFSTAYRLLLAGTLEIIPAVLAWWTASKQHVLRPATGCTIHKSWNFPRPSRIQGYLHSLLHSITVPVQRVGISHS